MANMTDYAKSTIGNTPTSDNAFNEIDGLILSELAYIHWDEITSSLSDEELAKHGYTRNQLEIGQEGMTLQDAIGLLKETDYYKNTLKDDPKELLDALENNDRFKNMQLGNFEASSKSIQNEDGVANSATGTTSSIEQFAAMTFAFKNAGDEKQQVFVAYRGTDGTLEGWNEDFLMMYEPETQAQRDSAEYLNKICEYVIGDLRLGGHSKGGNNGNYAFLFCDESVREHIVKLYSYDGPGFCNGVTYNGEPADSEIYNQMLALLAGTSVAPFDSIIGNLLVENGFTYIGTDTTVLMDHDPFSWQIDTENGTFVKKEQSEFSKYFNELSDKWVAGLTPEQRQAFVDTLWAWIYTQEKTSLDDVGAEFKQKFAGTTASLLDYINDMPVDTKKEFLTSVVKLLILAELQLAEDQAADVLQAIGDVLSSHNINSLDELLQYVSEDPIEHTVELASELITDDNILKQLIELDVTVKAEAMLNVIIAASVITLSAVAEKIGEITATVSALQIAADYIVEHWNSFKRSLVEAEEYAQEKLSEFAEAAMAEVRTKINEKIASTLYQGKQIVKAAGALNAKGNNYLNVLGQYASKSVKKVLKATNPFAYATIRSASGLVQSPVTIDMIRLLEVVEQMDRLASRVQTIDARLDTLYRKLCISNIEQEEGIFTSIVNLYNLCSADINVDEGQKIRRKANAISELFHEYKDAESWVLNQIGG